MLTPRDRNTLLASLRPPAGFRVDAVVATTFTLDLTALLTAPLAFSLLDSAAEQKHQPGAAEPEIDPYALLRAAREHAERIVVFCDATHISTPAKYRPLFAYLEKSVVEVLAPHEMGVFHPKVWVLRFANEGGETVYRLLCSTRNLTFDSSWDTLLVLDGALTDRKNAIAANRPLSAFVEQLPGLIRPGGTMTQRARELVAGVADDLLRVRFELPAGVEQLAFHPLGFGAYTRFAPPERIQKCLVVSPFADPGGLKLWSADGAGHTLVSRLDQLDGLSDAAVAGFESCFVLQDAAEEPDDSGHEADAAANETAAFGLHAKLFVVDDGWQAHVFTGSANATTAGFSRNVEFLTELTGKKSLLGVDQFLERGFGPLLQIYSRTAPEVNAVREQLEVRLLILRRRLAQVEWIARVGLQTDLGFPFTLHAPDATVPESEGIRVRPITLSEQHSQALGSAPGVLADFGAVSLEALTPFFTFHIRLEAGGEVLEADLCLSAKLEGAPDDREARVMAAMLDDPQKVMGFLSLLLSDDMFGWAGIPMPEAGAFNGGATPRGWVDGLLERLLKALHNRPEQLDSIANVLKDLLSTDAGRALVSPELLAIWGPIYSVRQSMNGARS